MKLLIAGASGVVGQAVLNLALADPRISQVIAPTRRALPMHAKLLNPILDFSHLPAHAEWWAADAMICALGTTIKVAGSPEQFIAIDRDLVVQMASLARQAGVPYLALNSSVGASLQGSLYLRTKAQAEQGVRALQFPRLLIVRPSLIKAKRSAIRVGEQLGLVVSQLLGPLMPKKYRPVSPEAIATALFNGMFHLPPGEHLLASEDL